MLPFASFVPPGFRGKARQESSSIMGNDKVGTKIAENIKNNNDMIIMSGRVI